MGSQGSKLNIIEYIPICLCYVTVDNP